MFYIRCNSATVVTDPNNYDVIYIEMDYPNPFGLPSKANLLFYAPQYKGVDYLISKFGVDPETINLHTA